MQRYFFNIKRGDEVIADEEGIHLPNLDAVREEARASAEEILSQEILEGDLPKDQSFVVRDESGQIVLTLNFGALLS